LFKDRFKAVKTTGCFREHQTKLNSSDFTGNRLKNSGTIPALFYAQWCPFCMKFYPEFQTAMKSKGIEWAEVDISNDKDPLWETFIINVVPTIILFKGGQAIFRKDGLLGRGLSGKAVGEVLQEIEKHETR
jgi:thiol-disulfide isomerase/thioredoxin